MNTQITIRENGKVEIPTIPVWLSAFEIANLFECFVAKISSNIRSILKSEVLDERKVCYIRYYGNGNSVEQYNLEMIIALSFRIKSRNARFFRNWIMKKMTEIPQELFVNFKCDTDKILLN